MAIAHEINLETQAHLLYHFSESSVIFLTAICAYFLFKKFKNYGK